MQSMRAFEKDLAALGSRLIFLRAPESRIALLQLVKDVGAQVGLASGRKHVTLVYDQVSVHVVPEAGRKQYIV